MTGKAVDVVNQSDFKQQLISDNFPDFQITLSSNDNRSISRSWFLKRRSRKYIIKVENVGTQLDDDDVWQFHCALPVADAIKSIKIIENSSLSYIATIGCRLLFVSAACSDF